MKSLEARLRSWKPRRPARALERQLWGRAEGRSRCRLGPAGWLAPVAAAVGLLAVLINPPGAPTLSSANSSNAWAELVLSNPTYAPYLPGSFERAHNQLEAWAGWVRLEAATNAAR